MRIEETIVGGSDMRYLTGLGHGAAEALQQARAAGERPLRRIVRVTEQPATVRREIVAEVPVDAPLPTDVALP